MEVMLKSNIKFVKFRTQKAMKKRILDFIMNSKADKILFKGDPNDINYKLLKKILPLNNVIFEDTDNSINKFVEINSDKNVRDVYKEFLDKVECEYCMIFKV